MSIFILIICKHNNVSSYLQVLGRVGQPEEVGLTCLYLAADATFCTGVDIQVSGGSALNYANKNMRLN
jgi:NAD(P)-dependent dehydrogenase (short-subunit alcohol dehydrogenase family)